MKKAKAFPSVVFLGFIILGAILVYAESMHDQRFYSADFVNPDTLRRTASVGEISITDFQNAESQEIIESKRVAPSTMRVGMNFADDINGSWEIIKVSDTDGAISYEKELSTETPFVVEMSMSSNSKVLIKSENNNDYIYNISLYKKMARPDRSTILLFREIKVGLYEIIEAIQLPGNQNATNAVTAVKESKEKLTRYEVSDRTCFLRAHDPNKSQRILMGNDLEGGTIEISNNFINLDGVILNYQANGGTMMRTDTFSLEASISESGTFSEEGADGVVTGGHVSIVKGKEIIVMFATGAFAQGRFVFGIGERCQAAEDMSEENEKQREEFKTMLEERNQRTNTPDKVIVKPKTVVKPVVADEESEDDMAEEGDESYEDFDEYDENLEEGEILEMGEEDEGREPANAKKVKASTGFNF